MKTDIQVAMATSRSTGAVGKNAIVPKYIAKIAEGNKILDFGCGKSAAHVYAMRVEGIDVYGYDYHIAGSQINLLDKYDIVYMSNVVNVQQSKESMENTIKMAWECVKQYGVMVFNIPATPRKGFFDGMTTAQGNEAVVAFIQQITGEKFFLKHGKSGSIIYTFIKTGA